MIFFWNALFQWCNDDYNGDDDDDVKFSPCKCSDEYNGGGDDNDVSFLHAW